MKIQQFIKSLNNTEIGKGGTHECYVLVSKKVENIENIFDPANHRPTFKASNYFLHLFPCTGTKSRKGYLV